MYDEGNDLDDENSQYLEEHSSDPVEDSLEDPIEIAFVEPLQDLFADLTKVNLLGTIFKNLSKSTNGLSTSADSLRTFFDDEHITYHDAFISDSMFSLYLKAQGNFLLPELMMSHECNGRNGGTNSAISFSAIW